MAVKRWTNRDAGRRGLTLIETALVMPLLVLMVFGMMEYGWMFLKSGEVANAARHGVRLGVVPDAVTSQVTGGVATYMSAAGLGGSGYTLTITPQNVAALNPGDTLTVSVSVPYSKITLTGIPLIPMPGTLRATVSMAKEGP